MLNITIIAIGKLKEKYLRDASAEYQKRLSASCKLNIIELNPEKLSDNPSAKEIENALNNEAKKIIEKIPKGAKVYSMCIEGKQRTSETYRATSCSSAKERIYLWKRLMPIRCPPTRASASLDTTIVDRANAQILKDL